MGAVSHTQPAAKTQFQIQEREKAEHDNATTIKVEPVDVLFPFNFPKTQAAIGGPTYVTPQTSVQHVAYALSDKVFSYSPESFDLDNAVKHWFAEKQVNAYGRVTSVHTMQSRLGAGSALLGYAFSKDKTAGQQLAQSVIATSETLSAMQNAFNQLSLLYTVASPVVAHVSAVDFDFAGGKLVTDYATPIRVARETGLGMVASSSSHEAQHMALFATLAASILPTVHIYDGVKVARETTRVVDVLDQGALARLSHTIIKEQTEVSKKADGITRVSQILQSLNAELGTAYSFFEYEGHPHPEAVLVVFGSIEASLATQVASVLAKTDEKVGVIAVRLISPFSEAHFIQTLPKTVKRIVVLGQVADTDAVEDDTIQSGLFSDVFSAVIMSEAWAIPPPVLDMKYPRSQVWAPNNFAALLKQIVQPAYSVSAIPDHAEGSFDLVRDGSQYVFWDLDDSSSASAPAVLARVLAGNAAHNISYTATYDNGPQAGVLQTEIRSSKKVVEAPYHIQNADVAVVKDIKLLSSFNVLATVRPAGTVLLVSNVADEDLEKKLPAQFRRDLVAKSVNLFILNNELVGEVENSEAVRTDLMLLAFLQLIGTNNAHVITSLLNFSVSSSLFVAAQELEKALRRVEPVKEWLEAEVAGDAAALPVVPTTTSFTPNNAKHEQTEETFLKTSQSVAVALSFKEAFDTRSALRPELAMKNFVVKVQSYKRLTPDYYDRNVFHIEFDISGTGLTYNIGEALGVHAHNDTANVNEFISWYGLDPEAVVEVPSREDPENELEARTVFQALTQNIDIFGRPPKKFYEGLAEFATDTEERKVLLTLSSAEGATEFKRRAEVDNVTYVDILQEFPSAHPQFYDLVKIVAPLKRREYSIASAQIVNPNSMHLLIVEVNWVDSKGRDRFGQATHYLSRLPIGSEVTVSVKPSVMKLPPSSTAPLIMAGLGTGLAPFRAFCQYRAWQKSQGMPIGPIMLYMGSRHQREEYLYGEEWEAYTAAGIITHLGCAFSRDQKEKIYIQDRMRQSKDAIIQHFVREEGAFYLCGPTWPVPDVAAVLVEAIAEEAKARGVKVDARKKLEELKDHERYILEVY